MPRSRRHSEALIAALVLLSASWALAPPAEAQELRGGLQLGTEAGYLTNTYLDPSMPLWSPGVHTGYGAVSPTGWLAWAGHRSSAHVATMGRFTTYQNGMPATAYGRAHFRADRAIGSSLKLGFDGGGSLVDGDVNQYAWNVLPFASWRPSFRTNITARLGLISQHTETPTSDNWQSSSLLAGLEAERWLGLRTSMKAGIHASQTQMTEEHATRGLGGNMSLSHRFRGGPSLRAEIGLEQYGYHVATETETRRGPFSPTTPETVGHSDLLWRAALSGEWPITHRWTLLGRSAAVQFNSSGVDEAVQDVQFSLGFRVSLQGSIYEPEEETPVWAQEGETVHFRFLYEGDGELYLVGDFNNWDEPGAPLTDRGGDIYTAQLELEPGAYQYRVRIKGDDEDDWLPLPEHALSARDDYDGKNGLLIVEPDASN